MHLVYRQVQNESLRCVKPTTRKLALENDGSIHLSPAMLPILHHSFNPLEHGIHLTCIYKSSSDPKNTRYVYTETTDRYHCAFLLDPWMRKLPWDTVDIGFLCDEYIVLGDTVKGTSYTRRRIYINVPMRRHHVIKECGRMDVWLHSFLNSEHNGDEWSTPRPGHFTLGQSPQWLSTS